MIAPLRARHRALVGVLALLLPLGFAAAIAGRDDESNAPALPDALADEGPALGTVRAMQVVVHAGLGFELETGDDPQLVGVRRSAGEPQPSMLVYWTDAEVGDELPNDAVLLGALGERGRRFRLPRADGSGAIVVFGLAHGEVLATLPVRPKG